VRIDKWLWAARFFKTRSLAAEACDSGRILSGAVPAKPAREVKVGDRLTVRNPAGEFQVEVLLLSHIRGPAHIAQTLDRESEESKLARQQLAEQRKLLAPFELALESRPTKRDRRVLDRFRGRG
jgi:ribosome-associated heat shock protein Hsp15